MTAQHERIARVEGIDESTGVFQMTLATEGEASDGHILSIKGGQIPERMPLLVSHYNEPTTQAGSITAPQKALKDSPPRLRATGRIEMSGEGPSAEIRRDLAHMISKGHVNAMSIRWDEVPGKTIRRINLPSNHPYYVDSESADGPERWGCFFEEWVGREGSIGARGAAAGARIGRADVTLEEVSPFWRARAGDLEGTDEPTGPEIDIDMGSMYLEPREEPTEEAKQAAALASVRTEIEQAVALGIAAPEILREIGMVVESDHDPTDVLAPSLFTQLLEKFNALESRLDDLEAARDDDPAPVEASTAAEDTTPEPDPEPESETRTDQPVSLDMDLADIRRPPNVNALVDLFAQMVSGSEERIERRLGEIIAEATGKV